MPRRPSSSAKLNIGAFFLPGMMSDLNGGSGRAGIGSQQKNVAYVGEKWSEVEVREGRVHLGSWQLLVVKVQVKAGEGRCSQRPGISAGNSGPRSRTNEYPPCTLR